MEEDLVAQLRGYLALAPGCFISHVTAARLWNIPLPAWAKRRRDVDIARRRPATQLRREGVIGHRLRITREEITEHHGLWLTTPARTWRDLASSLSVEDLVVAGDYLIRERMRDFSRYQQALCSQSDLINGMLPHVPGSVRLRTAAQQIRPGVDSPQETRLRLRLIAGGLPEPVVNHPLEDPYDGRPLRWGDLAYPEFRIVVQYEGDHHRSSAHWALDITRDSDWHAAGWTVIRLLAADLRDSGLLAVAKVRAALLRAGWVE